MTIQKTINKIEDFVGGNSHEDAMAFTRFLRSVLSELCLTRENEAYKEAMKEVEGMDVMGTEGNEGWNSANREWKCQRDIILAKLKKELGLS